MCMYAVLCVCVCCVVLLVCDRMVVVCMHMVFVSVVAFCWYVSGCSVYACGVCDCFVGMRVVVV